MIRLPNWQRFAERNLSHAHRVVIGRVFRRTRMDLWFPHVPLALALMGAGLIAALPTFEHAFHFHIQALDMALAPVAGFTPHLTIRGVPQAVVGILQILIGLGMLTRSRMAWISALLIVAAQISLIAALSFGPQRIAQLIYLLCLFVALILARRIFNRSSLATGTLFALASVLLLLVYSVLGSYLLGQEFSPPIKNLGDALYFAIVTMSTVGYGDITPKTFEARLFVISIIILGIAVFATALTAILGPMLQNRINSILAPGRKPMKRINHYIIAGNGILARNAARELADRGQAILAILPNEQGREAFGNIETIIGDPTELDVLKEAGAQHAKAVLALTDDDSENAFIILAMTELVSDARKIAAVSSRKNLSRMRRVHPDMILAPGVFAGEVLAMALTEEHIDGDALVGRMLNINSPAGDNP